MYNRGSILLLRESAKSLETDVLALCHLCCSSPSTLLGEVSRPMPVRRMLLGEVSRPMPVRLGQETFGDQWSLGPRVGLDDQGTGVASGPGLATVKNQVLVTFPYSSVTHRSPDGG